MSHEVKIAVIENRNATEVVAFTLKAGSVLLPEGEVHKIATITKFGLRREHDVPVYLGLPLDQDGRVVLDET